MAIEAQLCPNNDVFSICGSKNVIIDNIQSCLNSQVYDHKHNLQVGEQQCLQHLHHERQMHQNMSFIDPTSLCSSNSNTQNVFNNYNHNIQPLVSYRQGLTTQFDEQREIDHYLKSQNEKLRIQLQEQRKQQVGYLMKKMELNALYLLKRKDEEIAEATKKTTELKEFLKRLELENQLWRKVAEENEGMVLSLRNTLEEMRERALYQVGTEDAESCCDDNMMNTAIEEETGENRMCLGGAGEVEQITKRTMDCKCCHSQKSCFMFLPCRHLCSCKTCEPFLQLCPVCSMPKKSSIETLIV